MVPATVGQAQWSPPHRDVDWPTDSPRGLGTGRREVELNGRFVCVHKVARRREEVSSVTARKE